MTWGFAAGLQVVLFQNKYIETGFSNVATGTAPRTQEQINSAEQRVPNRRVARVDLRDDQTFFGSAAQIVLALEVLPDVLKRSGHKIQMTTDPADGNTPGDDAATRASQPH